MSDLHDEHWRPEYTGDDSRGDVGSGRGFGADLYALYRVGRLGLPAVAEQYAELTSRIHRLAPSVRAAVEIEGFVEPAHRQLMALRGVLQHALRESAVSIGQTGQALVEIANDYAATDEEATRRFAELLDEESDQFEHPQRPVPQPPRPGDPREDRDAILV